MWQHHTSTAGFVSGLSAVTGNRGVSTDELNTALEAYLLREALKCGVVRCLRPKRARNPTKLLLRNQPWFNA